MQLFLRLCVTAVAFWLTTLILGDNFDVVGEFKLTADNEFINRSAVFIVIALIFALINAILKPIATIISLPLLLLTLGLFAFVINAGVILLIEWITESTDWGLEVNGFWWGLLAAILISIISSVGHGLISNSNKRR